MKEKPTIFLFERGINGWQSIFGDWKNWPNQAIVIVNTFDDGAVRKGQTLTYFTSPFFAGLTRRKRALNFSKLIRAYSVLDYPLVIVAHSEGTATVIEALRLAGWPKVKALHLLAGAADANFYRNGLNQAVISKKIDRIICYAGGRDSAMKWEDTKAGLFFFGIRDPLGLIKSPQHAGGKTFYLARNVSVMAASRIDEVIEDYFGHSDWWLPDNFEKTMKHFI